MLHLTTSPPTNQTERLRIEAKFKPILNEELGLSRLISYVGNKSVPLLKLYRYKEAFSFEFVNRFLDRFQAKEGDIIFDPFAGMGTTLFSTMLRGLPSIEGIPR